MTATDGTSTAATVTERLRPMTLPYPARSLVPCRLLSIDSTIGATDAGKNDIILVKANHTIYVRLITYETITVAAQVVTFQDDDGTPMKIATIPASQATPVTFDFGDFGTPLTQGKNLDISNTAGPAARIHVEGYQKLTGVAAA